VSIFPRQLFAVYLFLFTCLLVSSFGVCISQTTDLYRDFDCDVGITSDALKIARGEVGIKEKGQNRGEVEKYQRLVGNPIGSPYCYSGIYWCFEQSSVKLKKKNPLLRTGLASAGRIYLEKYAVTSKKIGQIGLIFWQYPRKSTGHVEFYFKRFLYPNANVTLSDSRLLGYDDRLYYETYFEADGQVVYIATSSIIFYDTSTTTPSIDYGDELSTTTPEFSYNIPRELKYIWHSSIRICPPLILIRSESCDQ